jgi:hypothetical protein
MPLSSPLVKLLSVAFAVAVTFAAAETVSVT